MNYADAQTTLKKLGDVMRLGPLEINLKTKAQREREEDEAVARQVGRDLCDQWAMERKLIAAGVPLQKPDYEPKAMKPSARALESALHENSLTLG